MLLHKAYIGIGSNIGNRMEHLREAVDMLGGTDGILLEAVSSIYMTEPVGDPEQQRFYNGVVLVGTTMEPEDLRQCCKTIERDLGRPEAYRRWSPRVIDLDILLFGDRCCRTDTLSIPHPEMYNRKFVLVPLLDIANPPDPTSGKTARQFLAECPDRSVLIELRAGEWGLGSGE
ncbi:MAG: 2-amino-4-hydroxy-6-hydroxymethyldihydropteridine diphosphokinase [Chlorobiaceae bacterium]|nr:2-amino-4-hydroxy-6-hydroxymethyldihydropteridine diphosphokinase [Chlorobiaceae bacterium]